MSETKVVRVLVTKICFDGKVDSQGRWYLCLMADDKITEGELVPINDPRILGMVALNKSILLYLREEFTMIEGELREEG